ncbi:MAG TPA: hypothetical protein VFP45_06765 [Candidatus Nitrosotalea sp.]|nr:hypothetical protein [Candidatus Nitrosotalea sp.]HXU96121.1 hypothetical protein [Candidatus Nitrosotalea sp.]
MEENIGSYQGMKLAKIEEDMMKLKYMGAGVEDNNQVMQHM